MTDHGEASCSAGRARPRWLDGAIAAGFVALDTALTLSGSSWWPAHPGALAWALLGLQAAADSTLIFRRRMPLAVLGVITGFTVLITLMIEVGPAVRPEESGSLIWAPLAAVLVSYLPAQYRRIRLPGWALVGVLTVVSARPWDPSVAVVTLAVLRTAVGPLLALYFGARQRLVAVLRERAERAEREQHLLAEQARADERARLASEMHDAVTHRLSLMVLSAGALRVTATDDATRQAAEELRAAGCQALDELRDLVGVLRTSAADARPASADLATLAAESQSVGIEVDLAERGDPAGLSPVVRRTLGRIVQEGLTNVRKHAPGARVRVEVDYGAERLRVTLRNTAPTAPADPALAATGSGAGLAGLRQRVELMRGSLRARRTDDGGFEVAATLPVYVPTPEPMPEPTPEPAQ